MDVEDLYNKGPLKRFSRWDRLFIYSDDLAKTNLAGRILMDMGYFNLAILNTDFAKWKGTVARAY